METICRILTKEEFNSALSIRLKVFVDEQNVPLEEERDHYDDTAIHFGAFVSDTMVATGRLIILDDNTGKIGRMAVLREYRGLGIGLTLLNSLIHECRRLGLKEAILSAQLQAIPFYEKAGFTAHGESTMMQVSSSNHDLVSLIPF